MVIDLEVYYDLNDRISTHVNDKRMQKSKSAHQNHRRGHQNSKNDIWRYRRLLTLDDLSVPRKGHDIIISVQTMDITPRRAHPQWHAQRPIDVHITSKKKTHKKTPSSQVTGVETLWTQISLTWPWKQVTGQTKVMAGTILRFSGKMQIFKD